MYEDDFEEEELIQSDSNFNTVPKQINNKLLEEQYSR